MEAAIQASLLSSSSPLPTGASASRRAPLVRYGDAAFEENLAEAVRRSLEADGDQSAWPKHEWRCSACTYRNTSSWDEEGRGWRDAACTMCGTDNAATLPNRPPAAATGGSGGIGGSGGAPSSEAAGAAGAASRTRRKGKGSGGGGLAVPGKRRRRGDEEVEAGRTAKSRRSRRRVVPRTRTTDQTTRRAMSWSLTKWWRRSARGVWKPMRRKGRVRG